MSEGRVADSSEEDDDARSDGDIKKEVRREAFANARENRDLTDGS